MNPRHAGYAHNSDQRIYYEVFGDGPPLVLLLVGIVITGDLIYILHAPTPASLRPEILFMAVELLVILAAPSLFAIKKRFVLLGIEL